MTGNKYLFLARHAKSSWKETNLHDGERPLNKRGKRDAPIMGERLATQTLRPEHIVSSPAVRAIRTAEVFARCLNFDADSVEVDAGIYDASASGLVEIIRDFDDRYQIVMLVGHNPALTSLLNLLTHEQINNMPTCSIATISFDEDSWRRVRADGGRLVAFDYPKR